MSEVAGKTTGEVVELFKGGRFSEEARAKIIGKFYSLIERGLASSVERQICEEGRDEIISLIDSDGWALYTVGQRRDGTWYAFDQDCEMLAEGRDLDVVLAALGR